MIATLALPWDTVHVDIPVDPDAPDAQHWLEHELAKPQYQGSKPGLFEQLLQKFFDWVQSLLPKSGPSTGFFPDLSGLLPALLVLLVLALLVVAFFVFGVPRLNRRSRADGELFGDDDDRDADTLRRDAARAAASGDYATAIADLFRALARRLHERAVVSSFPGTTARGFARRASAAFPAHAERLSACAADFDDVRYLGAAGTEQQWERIRSLEAELHDARSTHEESLDEFAESLR